MFLSRHAEGGVVDLPYDVEGIEVGANVDVVAEAGGDDVSAALGLA
jgi:hypothetical protein